MSKKRSVANGNFHIPPRNDRLTETSLCNRHEITRSIEKRYRRKKPGQRVKSAEHFRERGGVGWSMLCHSIVLRSIRSRHRH